MPLAEARRLAGATALIGLSTHSPEQIEAGCGAPGGDRPDQLSVGPVWETPTKAGRPATGLGLIELAAREATVPWFAIGGIDVDNVADVAAAGASRIVVVRAIRDAEDPEGAARALRRGLEAAVGEPPAQPTTGANG
jgi:thiamine-phosphate pyrophosphorylase